MQTERTSAANQRRVDDLVGHRANLFGRLTEQGLRVVEIESLPVEAVAAWFGHSDFLDALVGAVAGSISAGHPVSSYVLGGELLDKGVSLVAVTAFLVSWVSVGSIQLPAEAVMLGWRFALLRNLVCFLSSILIAVLTVATLGMIG